MITFEETVVIDAERRLILTLPDSVTPGTHQVRLVFDEPAKADTLAEEQGEPGDFPVFHGLELKSQNLSRSVLYDDWGR